MSRCVFSVCLLLVALPVTSVSAQSKADEQSGLNYFEEHIRPVLIDYCYECHSSESDEPAGGLRLDLKETMHSGGDLGPAVVPGDLSESLILSALRYDDLEMPPDEKLDDDIIQKFETWIEMGAPDPRTANPAPKPETEEPATKEEQHWSFLPVQPVTPPEVNAVDWVYSDIDRFILARLEENQLTPSSDAPPETILRRLSFALRGLPPEPEAIQRAQTLNTAAVVDMFATEWMATPQYGERWARHWLDVVRYGESAGSSRDVLMLYSWRYRDYVIEAFNADMPWDQFIREQVAGDLLAADSDEDRRRQLIATGVLAIGSKSLNGGNLTLDLADDQIDVISKSFMGLTVSCARCHDHKFDPIPTQDYYALAGIFRSSKTFYGGSTNRPKNDKTRSEVYFNLNPSENVERPEDKKTKDRIAQLQKSITRLQKQVKLNRPNSERTKQTLTRQRRELEELKKQLPPATPSEYAFAVVDTEKPRDWPIQVRGEKDQNGEVVPRGFLSCIETSVDSKIPSDESGRRQLAEWLTAPDHPLTSRVIVNRVWKQLFGTGLVATVDNFGVSGERPSHPELLDWLAHRFVHEHHWSLKALIHEIVSSHTWQQSAAFQEAGWDVDPGNRLLWRSNRRRLEAEAIRDSILSVAGSLDLTRPQGSLVQQIGEGEVGRNIKTAVLDKPFPHRSVYLPIIRGLLPEMLKAFDFPEPSIPQGTRTETNVPTQSLFLMNSPFVIEQATLFAKRVEASSGSDDERLRLAWLLAYGRSPESWELEPCRELLERTRNDPDAGLDQHWLPLCHALLASTEFRFIE